MQNAEEAAEIKKKRTFRKFSYRGIDLDQYVATTPRLSDEQKTSSGITTAALATPHKVNRQHTFATKTRRMEAQSENG